MSWALLLVPHLKALHVAALAIWSAGLLAVPVMLARHDPAIGQEDYTLIRRTTHYGYIYAVTPAAVIAIASGLALVFLREVFVPWMFAKLVAVAFLVAFHAWVGHTLVAVAESEGEDDPPNPFWPLLAVSMPITAILVLVLAKPELGEIPLPGWLHEPVGVQLPFDVPRR